MEEFIKDLIRKNFTAKTIKTRCEKQGYTVTTEEIESIRNKVNLELKAERKSKTHIPHFIL